MKLVSIICIVLVIIFGIYLIIIQSFADYGQPIYGKSTLISTDHQSKLYIKTKNWGLTDDNQLTVISSSPDKEFEADSLQNIIFKGLEPFLYNSNKDTLFLYIRQKVSIPKGFKSKWVIKQVEIDNPKMMNLRRAPQFNKI